MQGQGKFQGETAKIKDLKIRNSQGDMVPLGAILSVRVTAGPLVLDRLDGQPMVQITVNPAAKASLRQVRAGCERLAGEVRKELRLSGKYGLTWLREIGETQ
jgi:multidrug efflux pump subunit AcrB